MTVTQAEIESVLCRSLTTCEVNGLNLEISAATTFLEEQLCNDLADPVTEDRFFEYDGTGIILTDIYSDITAVELVDCNSGTEESVKSYSVDCNLIKARRGSFQSSFYNSIRICENSDCGCSDTVYKCDYRDCYRWKITATWGIPDADDLKVLLARLTAEGLSGQCGANVSSKDIEGVKIAYRDPISTIAVPRYAAIIDKYRNCRTVGLGD